MIRGALLGVIQREFKRLVRQRGRLASTFARPVIWLIIIGSGFSALVPGGNFAYHKFLLPGIIGMILLFSSLLSALGSVHDREFGSMRMLMIAPVPRGLVVIGKTISSTLIGGVFALVLSPLVFLFEAEVSFISYLGFLGAALLTALALSSLGMLIASRLRSLENFAVAMNFVIFPMFFLSGALYPAEKLPEAFQPLVRLNPLTYGVDLMRHTLLAAETEAVSHVEYMPAADVGFLVAFSVLALIFAVRFFGREEHLAPMLLGRAPRSEPLLARVAATLHLHPGALGSSRLLARLPRASRSGASERASPGTPTSGSAPAPRAPTNGAALAVQAPTNGAAPAQARQLRRAGSLELMLRGVLGGVIARELKRAVRQRGRLVSTFARPLLWLIVVGAGFEAIVPGGQYHKYLLPGIIGMSILFSALLAALASVHDREFGPMRMLMIAPVPRGLVVVGKTLSATLLSTIFALVLSPLIWIYGIEVTVTSYVEFVGAVVLCSLALSSLGMLIASCIRQLENFTVAMNFVIFPLFFLSGALYPAENLPVWLQPIVRVNPLTYGVDLMRHALLINLPWAVDPIEFKAAADVGFLVAFTVIALILAVRLFGREDHLSAMFLEGSSRRVSKLGRAIAPRRLRLGGAPAAAGSGVPGPAGGPAGGTATHVAAAATSPDSDADGAETPASSTRQQPGEGLKTIP